LAPRRREGGVRTETDEPGVAIADERLGNVTLSSSWMPVRTRGFENALPFPRRNGFAALFGSSLLYRQNVLWNKQIGTHKMIIPSSSVNSELAPLSGLELLSLAAALPLTVV
jgi:hypothetical protein